MGLILDSQIMIWSLKADPLLKPQTVDLLRKHSGDLFLSVASIWETEMKIAIGKLNLPGDLLEGVAALALTVLPIVERDARTAARLPLHHRDPFDRMIVAHAINHGLTLVTSDRMLGAYQVPVIWA